MLEKLTPEQESMLDPWAKKWINIGLSTERADRKKAETALRGLYRCIGQDEPRVFWLPCPMSGLLAAIAYAQIVDSYIALYQKIMQANRLPLRKARDMVPARIHRKVDEAILNRILERVDSIGLGIILDAISGGALSQNIAVLGRAWGKAWGIFDNTTKGAIYDAVARAAAFASPGAVAGAIENAVHMVSWSELPEPVGKAGFSIWGCSLCTAWPAFVSYFTDICGFSLPNQPWGRQLAESCGFCWVLDGVAFATERPVAIHLDEDGKLHHPTGKAIAYESGWGLNAWHGTVIPEGGPPPGEVA